MKTAGSYIGTGKVIVVNVDHGLAVERRQKINGQPNGYKPISEAELQAEHLQEQIHDIMFEG